MIPQSGEVAALSAEIGRLKSDLANDAFELMRANTAMCDLAAELARVRGERDRAVEIAVDLRNNKQSTTREQATARVLRMIGPDFDVGADVAAALAAHDRARQSDSAGKSTP